FLLYLNNEPKEELPLPLQDYLNYGESIGIDKKVLISTRQPWYKMEKREPPEFLFTYLGRRNSRFIKNEAEVIPLTSFLCVYSHFKNIDYINKLWIILNDESTINNINLVGKSYGSGAIKVEPKALANLPISENLVEKLDILPYKPNQIIQNKFNF
ncbi:MAG: SAM-dependent methyltransferase, partial [Actinobacteria bacterium]|nr:SAM-dependent methyltransferase [Actinomycetota bacterium]